MAYKEKSKALEKRREYFKENREVILHKQRTRKKFKVWRENFVLRKPKRPNKDHELYCTNDVWAIDHNMFLNVDYLRDVPIELLSVEYWQNKEIEYQVYLENHNKKYGKNIPVYVSDKAYLEPDKEYGEYIDENGNKKIRFYPT